MAEKTQTYIHCCEHAIGIPGLGKLGELLSKDGEDWTEPVQYNTRTTTIPFRYPCDYSVRFGRNLSVSLSDLPLATAPAKNSCEKLRVQTSQMP